MKKEREREGERDACLKEMQPKKRTGKLTHEFAVLSKPPITSFIDHILLYKTLRFLPVTYTYIYYSGNQWFQI
jgi:hypothetical protein